MELPSEIQYEILMDLTPQEIIRYCRTNKEAREVCSSERFWNQKALHDFEIPLIMSPLNRYMDLAELINTSPESIVPNLLRMGIIAPIPKILDDLEIFEITRYSVGWKGMMESFLMNAVESRKPESLKALLDYIKSRIPANRLDQLGPMLRDSFFDALRIGEPKMVEMMKEYYDPSRETPERLGQIFRDQISSSNLPGIEYLQPYIKNEYPLIWIKLALEESHPDIIQYFYHRYPRVFKDPENVNYLAGNLASGGYLQGLHELVMLARPLINFGVLKEEAQSPELIQYLSQF